MAGRASFATWRVPEPSEIAQWAGGRWVALRQWLQTPANKWLVALLAVALLARLSALDLAPFGQGQAHWLAQARQVATPLDADAALAADEVPAPELLTAIMALGLGRDGDACGAIALLALLQMGALIALALTINRHLGSIPALTVAGILGLSPWMVFAARNLSVASLTITASILLFAVLLSAILDRNGWAWAASLLLVALALANDPRALALGLVWLGAVILHYDRVRWAPLLVGLVLAVVVAFGTNLGNTLLASLVASARSAGEAGSYVEHLLAVIRQTASMLAGRDLAMLANPSEAGALLTHTLLERLRQLVGLIFWLALPWSAWQAVQGWSRWQERDKGPERTLVALGLWLPLLLSPRLDETGLAVSGAGLAVSGAGLAVSGAGLAVSGAGLAGSALAGTGSGGLSDTGLIIIPAAAVAMGLLLAALPEQLRRSGLTEWRWVWRGLLGLGALALTANLYAALAVPRLAARQDMQFGYGTPYRLWRLTEELVNRGFSRSHADQLWIQATGPQGDTAQKVFPEAALLRDPSGQLLPAARPGLYLQWNDAAAATAESLLERLGSREIGTVAWPDGSQAVVFELRERPSEELLALVPGRVNAHFDAGMYLVGYDWPSDAVAGAELTLATYWTFGDLSSQDQATAHTVHLAVIAANGQQLTWSGQLALDGAHWQEGLLLRQETVIAIPDTWPAGQAQLYVEVHRATDGQAVVILDAPTRPGDTTAYLGQVTVN